MEVARSKRLLLDTDILVDVIRDFRPTIDLLSRLHLEYQLQICLLTEMEILAGCRNKQEMEKAIRFMQRFECVIPSESAQRTASLLIREHRLKHGLSIPDAIIAGVAIQEDLPLLTRNQKHFQFIESLNLYSSA